MSQIRTKIYNSGDENESTWPSQFGTLDRTPFHIDREGKELKKGYPERNVKQGVAPTIILDETTPYYHPATCSWTSSKKQIREFDKATGTITTDKKQAPDKSFTLRKL